jgi:hypothetical protein
MGKAVSLVTEEINALNWMGKRPKARLDDAGRDCWMHRLVVILILRLLDIQPFERDYPLSTAVV